MDELKPCPFCGGEARWVEDHGRFDEPFGLVVEHAEDCFLGNRMMAEWEHIIAAWNTRQSATTEALAAMEQAREALETAERAIAEYYRYWTGGETRGSYDGKPERSGLWEAHRKAALTLATLAEQIERMRHGQG